MVDGIEFAAQLSKVNQSLKRPGCDIEVIVAGLSKTSTLSIYAALQTMGYATYHMAEVVPHKHLSKKWLHVINKKNAGTLSLDNPDDVAAIKDLLNGYQAGTDAPFNHIWQELAILYPNAKVVLTVRDEDRWWNSITYTMDKPHWSSPWYKAATFWIPVLWWQLKLARALVASYKRDYGWGPRTIRNWNREIIASVPKERLLVFDVKEGYEPLCKFLGKPVPQEAFPNINDSASLRKIYANITRLGMGIWAAVASVTVGAAWYTLNRQGISLK